MTTHTTLQLRNFDEILSRSGFDRPTNRSEFPPDFVHGDATLDEIYEAFGEEWVETAAFVQHHVDERGDVVGASVAYFDGWFLTVEHFGHEGVEARHVKEWLNARLENRRTVVELMTQPCDVPSHSGARWIDLRCSIPRLVELERSFLSVAREGSTSWRTVAQTNLLSVITLSARLGVERVH